MFESVRELFHKRRPVEVPPEVEDTSSEELRRLRLENATLRAELHRVTMKLDCITQAHSNQSQHVKAQEERIRELNVRLQPDPMTNHFGITGRGTKHHNHQGICG